MIRTRIIERVNTPQEIVIPGGIPGTATVRLDFQELPSAGVVTFERRSSYQGDWLPIQNGANLSVTGDPVEVKFDGGVNLLRVTFTGLSGGLLPVLTIVENETAAPPSFLMTDGGYGNAARLRVDNGQTGLFDRRMWRISHEFTALGSTPQVFRVSVPVNFMIHHQSLECDQGGIVMRAYRATQGVESGTFSTAVPIYSANFMDEEPAYAFQAAITTGGAFTPNGGQVAVEVIRARAANATAQQQSVGGSSFGERGLGAGIFYLIFSQPTGTTGDSKGVYNLVVEERPQ